jgi:hypothetical protein
MSTTEDLTPDPVQIIWRARSFEGALYDAHDLRSAGAGV